MKKLYKEKSETTEFLIRKKGKNEFECHSFVEFIGHEPKEYFEEEPMNKFKNESWNSDYYYKEREYIGYKHYTSNIKIKENDITKTEKQYGKEDADFITALEIFQWENPEAETLTKEEKEKIKKDIENDN